MKIGVYGGSFDPPHRGHKLLAENLGKVCGAKKILIIPAFCSPFKEGGSASGEDRLNMCRLNFSESIFEVSDIELSRGGKSYTVDTLTELKKLYPEDELFLFMGEDMLLSFDKWYRHRDIMSLAKIVAACRREDLSRFQEMKTYAKEKLGDNGSGVLISEAVPCEISSREIRANFSKFGEKFLDEKVYEYIKQRGLYVENK